MLKLVVASVLLIVIAAPIGAAQAEHQPASAVTAQPAEAHAAQPAQAAHQPDEHAADAEHASAEHGTFWGRNGPYVNFVILCGLLYYLFRQPLTEYLQTRGTGIRKDLVEAAELRAAATAQLAEIDRKIKALPGEIETLRRRGAEEIVAEEHRIAKQAASERERLLEQTRRAIEVQVRVAKRELVEHAADLAVQLATDRITQDITPADQNRLVDRYLSQMRSDDADH
jgi:F-type H+-transporting ATPase subunit b